MSKEIKEALIFCGITLCTVFFLFWGPLALTGTAAANIHGGMGPWWAIMVFVLGGFTPSLIAIILTFVKEGKSGLRQIWKDVNFRFPPQWYLYSLVVVSLSSLGTIFIFRLLNISWDITALYKNLLDLLPLLLLGPISEEFGWRGYALKRMLKQWNGLQASLVLGVIWSFWHLPLFFIPGTSQHEWGYPFLGFLVGITLSNTLYTVVYIKTKGSIWSVIFLHWMYTYFSGAVSAGIIRTTLYNWIEYLPIIFVTILVVIIFRKDLLKINPIPNDTINS